MHLRDPLSSHFRLTDAQKSALSKLGINSVRDLLYHFPFRYDMGGEEAAVAGLQVGMEASLVGTLEKMEDQKVVETQSPHLRGLPARLHGEGQAYVV
jgi:RecG-like helicase